MKRVGRSLITIGLMAYPSLIWGQVERVETVPSGSTGDQQPERQSVPSEPSSDGPKNSGTESRIIQQREFQVEILRRMMSKGLSVSEEQKKRIDRHIAAYFQAIRSNSDQKARALPEQHSDPVEKLSREELIAKVIEARDSGRHEEAERLLRVHSGRGNQTIVASAMDPPDILTEMILAELNEEQSPVFDRMVRRWKIIMPELHGDMPSRRLIQALRDPELSITDELRTQLIADFHRALQVLPRDERFDKPKNQEFVDKFKKQLKERLAQDDWKAVEATINYLDEIAQELVKRYGEYQPINVRALKPQPKGGTGE